MRELSIVVTCTGRKALAAHAALHARHLPAGSVSRRSDTWRERVHNSRAPRLPLRQLYRGEAWQRSLELSSHAAAAGFAPTVFVASAGLGLRAIEDEAPAYQATFSATSVDSVAMDDDGRREWWRALHDLSGARAVSELPAGPTLVVLSAAYAGPLAQDLASLAERGAEIMVIGGGKQVPGTAHLASNRSLRSALGGSAMSLNQRMAAAWLRRLDGRALSDTRAFDDWAAWESEVSQAEVWDRQVLSDELVIQTIKTLRSADEWITASRALRVLRDSGYSCEQKRFGRLFAAVANGTEGL